MFFFNLSLLFMRYDTILGRIFLVKMAILPKKNDFNFFRIIKIDDF